MAYSPTRVNSLELEAGLFIARELNLGATGYELTPRANLGLAFETMDTEVSVATRFASIPGLPAFSSFSPDFGRLRAIGEVGADLSLSDSVSLSFDYRGSFRADEKLHSVTLGLGMTY